MATGGNNRINFQVGFNVDQSSLNQVSAAFEKIRNFKPADFKGSATQLMDIKNKAIQVERALNEAFNPKLNSINFSTFTKELDKSSLSIKDIHASFSQLGAVGQNAFNDMSTAILTSNLNLKQTSSFIQNIGTTLMNTVKWTVASSAIKAFTGSISQAFTYVKSLDSSLNDIRIVTKDSADQMANFAVQANRAASELGRSTLDYTKAALTFYQQGLDDQAVQARTQAVLKAQNITGAGSEMADYLTAVWNGYKVVNEEAELYVDKLAAVADSSASNMSQIAVAMSKVSSAANSLGVDVDSLTAQIATIVATTRQAPESVGNALKTIYARINDISVGADDAEVTLGNYSTQMRSVGINVLDANGRLRDTGDVLDEVGEKWSTLSREQQIFLARTMAGQRQYNKLISLFDNWSKYTDLVTVSMQAQGATEQKNAIYMESLAAHTEQLGAAQQRLKSSMVDSDSYKNMIDVATSGITLFANFIQSIGGGGNALLMLGSIFTQVFSGTIAKEINGIITNMNNMRHNAQIVQARIDALNAHTGQSGQDSTAARVLNDVKNIYADISTQQKIQLDTLIKQQAEQQKKVVTLKEQLTQATELKNKMAQAMNVRQNKNGYNWEQFGQKIDIAHGALDNLKTSLDKVDGSANKLTNKKILAGLRESVKEANDALGGSNQKLAEVSEKIKNLSTGSTKVMSNSQLQAYINSIKEALQDARRELNLIDETRTDNLQANLSQAQKKAKAAETATKEFTNALHSQVNIQNITKGVAGIGQLASGITSLVNLTKIWGNENLSTGEKILQTFTSLSMGIGMVTSGFSNMQKGLTGISNIVQAYGRKVIDVAAAQKAQTASDLEQAGASMASAGANKIQDKTQEDVAQSAIKAAGAEGVKTGADAGQAVSAGAAATANEALAAGLHAVWHAMAPFLIGGAIVAGIIAIGLAIKDASSDLDEAKQKAKELEDQAKKARENFTSIQNEVVSLNNEIKSLANNKSGLAQLTIGTDEWRAKLAEVNAQVLKLIQKYPELKKYLTVSNSGELNIEDVGWQEIQQKQVSQQASAGFALAQAQTKSNEANNQVLIAQLTQDLNKKGLHLDTKDVVSLIQAVSTQGFENLTKTIDFDFDKDGKLTQSERELMNSINDIKGPVQDVINTINANNITTQNLITTITKSSIDFEKISGYNNLKTDSQRTAFENQYANQRANFSSQKYGNIQEWGLSRLSQIYSQDVLKDKSIEAVFNDDDTVTLKKAGVEIATKTKQELISGIVETEFTDEHSEEIANRISNQINGLVNKGGEKALALLGSTQQGIKIDTSVLSNRDIQQLKNNAEELASVLGVKSEQLTTALDNASALIKSDFDNFVKGLDPAIQQAFSQNGIDSSEYTKPVAQSFANLLQKALDNNDVDSFNFLNRITEGLNNTQLSAFTELANSIDYSTITAGELETKLHEAGIETDFTTQELQKYIEAQRKAAGQIADPYAENKSITDIVGNLQQGGTLDPIQYAKLTALDEGFSQFFKRTIDGTWELIATTDQFKKAVQSIKLDNLQKQIDENNTKIQQLSNVKTDATGTGDQLNALDAFGINTASLKIQFNSQDQQEASEAIAAIDKAYQELGLTEEKVAAQQQALKEENKELTEVVDRAREKVQGLNHALDTDVKEDKFKALSDYFNTRDVKGYADIFQEDREAAEELAEELLRFDSALEKVKSNYQNWKVALASGNEAQIGLILPDLSNAYSDLFDWDPSVLTDGFLQNGQALQYFNTVLNGTDEEAIAAYESLEDLAMQEIAIKASVDLQQFNSDYAFIQAEINKQLPNLEVGSQLKTEGFIQALNQLLTSTARTKEQAEAILKSLGVEAEVQQTEPKRIPTTMRIPQYELTYGDPRNPDVAQSGNILTGVEEKEPKEITVYSEVPGFKISGNVTKGVGGYNKVHSSPTRANTQANKKGGGGSKKSPKKSKKKGSSKKKKEEKTVDKDLGFENKQLTYDPYEQVTKQLERQSDQLEKLQKQEDKLTGKDRLANLQKQNNTLQKQNQLLRQRQAISDNANKKNTTAWFRKQLETTTSFKNIVKFDSDGQISDIAALQRNAEQTYNNTVKNAEKNYEAVEKKYNNYIKKYNKMSAKKQESSKVQKELQKWKEALKEAEETAKNAEKSAEEKYKLDTELIKSYTEALEKDNEARQNWLDNLDKITEIKFAKVKIGVDLSLEMGQLERDWLDFEDKFIKRLGKDDFLGQAQSSSKKLFSFFDTNQLEDQVKMVKDLKSDIAILNKGLKTTESSNKIKDLLGISAADWAKMTAEQKQAARQAALAMKKEDLQNYLKTLQNSLTTMQEQADAIRDSVLSGLDKAKSDMDDQISQFERVNSLIEHGAKLSEMLFGEKAYDNAIKFYSMQKENNIKQMQRIAQDRAYWENIYQQQRLADDNERDEQLMQKALSNLQAFDDQLRSTLEETIDILHNEWESKVQSTLQKMNNTLTSGYGLDFANEEWDYVTKFDDYFLDNVESKMGIEEIERLFDNASKAAAGDANAQARLSKIYQEQMKTLRNKEKLTQYDIDRAKKMLEIEQARLAIEKAREQKTTMRLRRDSQGNYTYRYVADEDQVADLADKLANLEYNLYEDDKNQYKKNLNQMLSFYEDYQKKIMELEWEMQQAKAKGDEQQIERMQKRIDALREYGQAMGDNLAANQDYITSTYWTQSTADSLGIENYTRQQMLKTMADNIPIVGVALQQLDKSIRSAGGFLEALAPFEKEITTAGQEYAAALTSAMDAAQTSTATMTADIDKAVDQTTKIVDNYDTIISKTKEEVDEVGRLLQNVNEAMEKLRSGTELMKELYNSYYSIQNLNQLNAADDKNGTDLVSRVGLTSTTLNEKMESLWAEWKDFYKALLGADEMATGGYTGAWGDDGRVAVLHEKELVLNAEDTSNLLAAVGAVRDITSRMSIAGALDSLAASQTGLLNTLYNQHSQLDQNVHIEANFPNVTQHTEIEQAFENLVNIASMHASKRVD